jgi:hypothetical protein
MEAVVFFDVNLNGLPDEGEPQTTSNGWGDYWLDIPLETYDLNGNGVIDISEGVIVSQGGTDTATGLPCKDDSQGTCQRDGHYTADDFGNESHGTKP